MVLGSVVASLIPMDIVGVVSEAGSVVGMGSPVVTGTMSGSGSIITIIIVSP